MKVHPGGKSEIIGAALRENCPLRRAWEFPSLLSECYMWKPIILQHTHIILMTAVDKISLNVSKYKQNLIHKKQCQKYIFSKVWPAKINDAILYGVPEVPNIHNSKFTVV